MNSHNDNSRKFTYEEVAAILGVSRTTLYNWQEQGRIPKGDFDTDTVEKIVERVAQMKQEETQAEINRMRRLFRSHQAGEPVAA